jgi:putative oxidoreductase
MALCQRLQTQRLPLRGSPFDCFGGVLFLEGVKKFLFVEQWSAGRFTRMDIPHPQVMAPFVGVLKIVCSFLLLIGLFTRQASIPLIIDICVEIASTKIPILRKSGFWPMEAEARTDYSMPLGLLFLLIAGAGGWSIDARAAKRKQTQMRKMARQQRKGDGRAF